MIQIKRLDIRLKADPRKVVPLFLNFGKSDRYDAVARYVQGLDGETALKQLEEILSGFEGRHFDLEGVFWENYEKLSAHFPKDESNKKKLLFGAYFTHEYSIQAAALFNPSIVPHPDQEGLKEGELRFILSLRAVGEGHISSIAFQTGVVSADGIVNLDESVPSKLSCGQKVDVQYDESYLHERLEGAEETDKKKIAEIYDMNYELAFEEDIPLSNRVLFPKSRSETNGMEDARFVAFSDGEEQFYLGTYTAYNGRAIRPQMVLTRDFQHFQIRPFYGRGARDKGMAFFPEKINGKYAMIGRQDSRTLTIMYSDDFHFWNEYQPLQQPERGWEMLQIGNCGSPVKTPYGWLVLTHAVGPMRKYVLSFTLLDLHKPESVLATLDQPFLSPNAEEREGYVPNVLYTCGLIQHRGKLIIPYAMSDSAISFAIADVEEVIATLLEDEMNN